MTKRTLSCAAVAAGVLSMVTGQGPARAQAPAGNPAFEVASVRPNKSGDGRVMLGVQPGGRFTATNVPLKMLLRQAYNVQDFQVVGGPAWLASDRFDVVAKAAEEGINFETMRPLVRSLLADRFKLKVHSETRQMPIYALVKARSDGTLGPSMKPSSADCAALMGRRGGGPPPAPPPPGQPADCSFIIGIGKMSVGGMPVSNLATALSPMVGRIVLDKTGLTGNYSYELTYSPEQLGGSPPQLLNGAPPTIDPNTPSIFTALQEQLGLKLDSDRGPVEVLVVDSAEQPTAD